MHINREEAIEKYLKNNNYQNLNSNSVNPINYGTSLSAYGKVWESYRMTEGGSYFMPNAVYTKPEKEEEKTVVEQLDAQPDMSAESRRNQMAVIANTTSLKDLKEMEKEGFSILDSDSQTITTVIDEIKANLAKMGVDISGYGDSLSLEQLEELTGSKFTANQISNMLEDANLPNTKENIDEVERAYKTAESIVDLGDGAKEYLIRNGIQPTIQNIYMAQYSARSMQVPNVKIDFASFENQLKKVIKDANLEINKKTLGECQWLVQKNIELNVKNLTYLEQLNALSFDISNWNKNGIDAGLILHSIVEAMQDGKRPMEAFLISGFSYMDKAKSAMELIGGATDFDVAYCVNNKMELSIEALSIAKGNREATISVSIEMESNIHFITAKRQLEETRLAMTLEANYSLLKRGIAIDTKPLEQLVEDLKNQENQYYKDLMTKSGVETTTENLNVFSKTTRYVEELKFQPAYILQIGQSDETITTLHKAGSILKTAMDKALQSYETLWTAPRKDMGDSIQKAFQNVDDILRDLGLEETKANQRAVRILAYNNTELNVENIQLMKSKDMEVQTLFENMTPAVTLEMIRRGENPLEMEITKLNELAESIQSELGEKDTERFSKFLWKLEKDHAITPEERQSYIGIYRLMAQVEKTDGAVIGALVNQGVDITMKNLLTAVRSGNKSMDYTVNDEFAGVKGTIKGARIEQQILASYQADCIHHVMNELSPQSLEQVKNWEDMTPEQLMEALQEDGSEEVLEQQYYSDILSEYTSVLEASDDVYAYLEKYDIKNSAKNVLAVSRLLKNPSNGFDVLFGTEHKSDDCKAMIAEMKNTILERFGEAVKTPEEMAEAQETLAEVAERAMQTMIIENEPVSVKDINDLRMMSQQFMLCSKKAEEESYLVPVATGDSVTGVSLKIVRGKEEKGFVDIFFRGALMEKVAASFEAKKHGISGMIATTDEETKKLFEDNLNMLVEKMKQDGDVVDIHVVKVEDLSMWKFEKNNPSETGEKNPVQTKRLYHMAESFIQTIQELIK